MKILDIKAISEDPDSLNRAAQAGELAVIMDHGTPVSVCVPVSGSILPTDVVCNLAVKLFEDGELTLVQAAKMACVSAEEFLLKLKVLGVVVVDQTAGELESDLKILDT